MLFVALFPHQDYKFDMSNVVLSMIFQVSKHFRLVTSFDLEDFSFLFANGYIGLPLFTITLYLIFSYDTTLIAFAIRL